MAQRITRSLKRKQEQEDQTQSVSKSSAVSHLQTTTFRKYRVKRNDGGGHVKAVVQPDISSRMQAATLPLSCVRDSSSAQNQQGKRGKGKQSVFKDDKTKALSRIIDTGESISTIDHNNCARSIISGHSSEKNENNSSSPSLPDMKSHKPINLDRFELDKFDFQNDVDRTIVAKPHLWPMQHDQSRNVFHYVSNVSLGRPTFQNQQAVIDSHIMNTVADFELIDSNQPFSCRITTIDWHPRLENFIAIGSKHGDMAFCKVGKGQHSLLQKTKSFEGIGPGGYISSFKFHPTDNEKFYTASIDGKVRQGNLETCLHSAENILLNTLSWERWFCSLDVHQTDNLVIAGKNNGLTTLMSRSGMRIWEKRLHLQKVSHLEFSPCESYLLCSASLDHTVQMWDLRMLVEKKPLECLRHQKGLNSAYFSLTDGARLVTTDQFDEIRVYRGPFWHLETCIKHPHRFFQHITPIKAYWHPFTDNILCGRFPDERNYPDYGAMRTMDMFDAATGKMRFELKDTHYNGIVSLCKFNKTGDYLLSTMSYNFYIWAQHVPTDDEPLSFRVKKERPIAEIDLIGQEDRSRHNRTSGGHTISKSKILHKDCGAIARRPAAQTKKRGNSLSKQLKLVVKGAENSGNKSKEPRKRDEKRNK